MPRKGLGDSFIAYFRRTVGVLPGETADFREGRAEKEPRSSRRFRVVLYVAVLALITYQEQFLAGLLPHWLSPFTAPSESSERSHRSARRGSSAERSKSRLDCRHSHGRTVRCHTARLSDRWLHVVSPFAYRCGS